MQRRMDFSGNPAFQAMSGEKQKMIELLAESLYHKNITEALPQIMAWKKKMQEKNISFTAEENKILTEVLMAEMSPAQRKQYEALKTFMR